MTNAPAIFQHMINDLFANFITKGWIVIYIDGMLIFSTFIEKHCQHTCLILEQLKQNNLFLKPEKFVFEQEMVEFLGLVLSPEHVPMDSVTVASLSS